ncbi:4a-hydroxytetrahydrobiopterin dehydratase [Aestuariirhabdus sp. LZHN29]|uniref:4a-hydroxytetrahydrobiopterin dehydratase n=1 Tax=Aestuariirhabdus sp. LZHN29 TaxID=3417462 RepID=UPI003CF07A98
MSDAEALLRTQYLSGWCVTAKKSVMRLTKTYRFNDFSSALDFANRIGVLAEAVNHHPLLVVEWGRVSISWWTHSIGGLHPNDFVLAAKTDLLSGH